MIYVFATSVKDNKDIRKLQPRLDELLTTSTWNFDLEDCDNILRIDSPCEITQDVITLLLCEGFDCQELL